MKTFLSLTFKTISFCIYILKVGFFILSILFGRKVESRERQMPLQDQSLKHGLLRRTDSRIIISETNGGAKMQKGFVRVRVNRDLGNAKRKFMMQKMEDTTERSVSFNENTSTRSTSPMKTRSKTLPNIFIAQRTRTLSEQSEEKDEIMPLPEIKPRIRQKSGPAICKTRFSPPPSLSVPIVQDQASFIKYFQTLSKNITNILARKSSVIPTVLSEFQQSMANNLPDYEIRKDSNRNEVLWIKKPCKRNRNILSLKEDGKALGESIIKLNGRSYLVVSQHHNNFIKAS